MAKLHQAELELLDFLCAVHAEPSCRIKRLKESCKLSLRRLRFAGLVGFDDFTPSAWAMHDWRERTCAEILTDQKCLLETRASDPDPEPAEAPEPEALADGDGGARKVTPSPTPSGAELAAELDRFIADHSLSKKGVGRHLFNSDSGVEVLRRTAWPRAATVEKVRALLANGPLEKLRSLRSVFGEALGKRIKEGLSKKPACAKKSPTPQIPVVTGPELQAELLAFIDRHILSKTAVAIHLFNNTGGINLLRWTRHPRQATTEKIRAFLETVPPPSHLSSKAPLGDRRYSEHKPKAGPAPEKRGLNEAVSSSPANESTGPARPVPQAGVTEPTDESEAAAAPVQLGPALGTSEEPVDLKVNNRPKRVRSLKEIAIANKRRSDTIRQNAIARAKERIEQGLPANLDDGVQVKLQQEQILRQQADEARLADPVEQAKAVLRKRYCPVVAAEFADPPGPKGKYLVGRRIVSEHDLIVMARSCAA